VVAPFIFRECLGSMTIFRNVYTIEAEHNYSICLNFLKPTKSIGFKYQEYNGNAICFIVVVHYVDETILFAKDLTKSKELKTECHILSTQANSDPNNLNFWGVTANKFIQSVQIFQTTKGNFMLDDIIF
jgi:hypothetical protein